MKASKLIEKGSKREETNPYPFSPYEKKDFAVKRYKAPMKWGASITNNAYVVDWQMEGEIPSTSKKTSAAGQFPASFF